MSLKLEKNLKIRWCEKVSTWGWKMLMICRRILNSCSRLPRPFVPLTASSPSRVLFFCLKRERTLQCHSSRESRICGCGRRRSCYRGIVVVLEHTASANDTVIWPDSTKAGHSYTTSHSKKTCSVHVPAFFVEAVKSGSYQLVKSGKRFSFRYTFLTLSDPSGTACDST